MDIKMEFFESDFINYNNEHIRRSIYRRKYILLIPLLIIIIQLLINRNSESLLKSLLPVLIISSLIGFFIWLVFKRAISKRNYKQLEGSWSLNINEQSLEIKSPQGESKLNWTKSMKIINGKFGLYIYTQPTIGLLIPNRYIKDEIERIAIFDKVNELINAANTA